MRLLRRIIRQRNAGADADFEDAPADALGRRDRGLAAALEHRAEHEVVDRRPARIGLGDRVACRVRPPSPPLANACKCRLAGMAAGYRVSRRRRAARRAMRRAAARRALDEAAAEHARLALGRVVEHAGLAGRNAVLAVDQFDLDAAAAAHQPGRLRRARRAHLDEHLAPAGARAPGRACPRRSS